MKNVNTTTKSPPNWLVFYIDAATSNPKHGILKKREYVHEKTAQKFARAHDSEVLPIIEGEIIG